MVVSALPIMEMIKLLGDAVRKRIPIADMELPETMRRLIAELERRQATRHHKRDRPQKHLKDPGPDIR